MHLAMEVVEASQAQEERFANEELSCAVSDGEVFCECWFCRCRGA